MFVVKVDLHSKERALPGTTHTDLSWIFGNTF